METEHHANIVKIDPGRRMFFGWSYVVEKDGDQVTDHSGDVIDTPEAIDAMESAFYKYVLESRAGDDGHSEFGVAKLVEQVVFTKEKIEQMGLDPATPVGVWSGYYAPETELGDRLLESIQSGRYKSLSIVGRGRREPIHAE
jgi:hypothetical protein